MLGGPIEFQVMDCRDEGSPLAKSTEKSAKSLSLLFRNSHLNDELVNPLLETGQTAPEKPVL